MNEIYTILLPLVGIFLLFRFVQYLCNTNKADKVLSLIIVTAIELASIIILFSFINTVGFTLLAFLSLIIVVVTNLIHTIIDGGDLSFRISKEASMLIVFLIQSSVIAGLFFLL